MFYVTCDRSFNNASGSTQEQTHERMEQKHFASRYTLLGARKHKTEINKEYAQSPFSVNSHISSK